MIGIPLIVFLVFFVWKSLALAKRDDDGLALAQRSRSKPASSLQDGPVRLSRVDKPENVAFEAPPLPHAKGGLGDAEADILNSLTLSDTVLLASIDGRFHAVNRTTGRAIWSMEDDSDASPSQNLLHNLVRTDHNPTPDSPLDPDNQELYIIEPQSGDIFVLSSSPSEGMSPFLAGHSTLANITSKMIATHRNHFGVFLIQFLSWLSTRLSASTTPIGCSWARRRPVSSRLIWMKELSRASWVERTVGIMRTKKTKPTMTRPNPEIAVLSRSAGLVSALDTSLSDLTTN